jgi:hypothetical protein
MRWQPPPRKKPEKLFSGGKGGHGPHFWSTIFFNQPEKGAGEFEPPQIFGPAMKTYRQFAPICCNLPQFAATRPFAAIDSLIAAIDR